MPADMRTRLGPDPQAELPNPVLAAAGCAGAGRELAQFIDVARVGALISKSIMAEPHTGNPAPRMTETPSGLLNSVGLQNPGVDAFLVHAGDNVAEARRYAGGLRIVHVKNFRQALQALATLAPAA